MATSAKSIMEVGIVKSGKSGIPRVTVMVEPSVSLESVNSGLLRQITRNKDLRKKLGLKACLGCISGMDFDIRNKFDEILQINLNTLGR